MPVFLKNCTTCHQMGGQGALIGPQLDGIGNRGLERLVEDILDPSRNVDPAFFATLYVLKDGRVFPDSSAARKETPSSSPTPTARRSRSRSARWTNSRRRGSLPCPPTSARRCRMPSSTTLSSTSLLSATTPPPALLQDDPHRSEVQVRRSGGWMRTWLRRGEGIILPRYSMWITRCTRGRPYSAPPVVTERLDNT